MAQTSPARTIPAVCTKYDAIFRSLTDSGNRAYSSGDVERAADHYARALDQAEAVFELARQEGGAAALVAPMLVNIGCHNLACLKRDAGDDAEAYGLIVRAVEQLIDGAESVSCPIEMRLNCVRHLRHALHPLVNGSDCPAKPATQTQSLIERAAVASAEVVRTAELCFSTDRTARTACARPS